MKLGPDWTSADWVKVDRLEEKSFSEETSDASLCACSIHLGMDLIQHMLQPDPTYVLDQES